MVEARARAEYDRPSSLMRAAILNAGRFYVENLPEPEPGPHDVVLAVSACGLCGTDRGLYTRGLLPDGSILGHEFAGHVVETGTAVREWVVGDRAAVIPIPYCDRCELCRTGQQNLCRDGLAAMIGCGGAPGGLAERVCVPSALLRRLPNELEPPRGALIEPLAVAWHATTLAKIEPGTRVGVIGLGPMGLFCGLLARLSGALVFGTDYRSERIGWAHDLGLGAFEASDQPDQRIRDLTRGGPDVVFEASGRPEAIERAAHLARVGGRVVLVASYHSPAQMTPGQWFDRGISLLPSIAYGREDFENALQTVVTRRIDVGPLVSKRYPLADTQQVFESFSNQTETAKLVIDPSA
jgi:(R,R)-butanediol dehydrogenase/meso-butanediol dehydrogenase/diacetyl reductase